MLVVKILRGLYKSLSGDGDPWQFALGFALGAFLGVMPCRAPDPDTGLLGLNLTWLLFFALVVVIRCSFHATVVGFVLFQLLAMAFIDPLSASLGETVLESMAPHDLVQSLYDNRVLSMLQLHTRWVSGALILGLGIGLVLYVLAYGLVKRYLGPVRERLQQSKTLRVLSRLWPLRVLRWLFVGGA